MAGNCRCPIDARSENRNGVPALVDTCQIESTGSMKYSRKHKSVAVEPLWVLWVVVHDPVPEDVSHWGHAHWGTRVTRVGLEGRIDLSTKKALAGCHRHNYPGHRRREIGVVVDGRRGVGGATSCNAYDDGGVILGMNSRPRYGWC